MIQSAAIASLLAIELAMEAAAAAVGSAGAPAGPASPTASPAVAAARTTAADPPVRPESGLSVEINRAKLAATDLEAISEVTVKDDVGAPSSLTLRLTGD